MDAPEAVTPHPPLASADDPPPSPGLGASRKDLGLASIGPSSMSMSWTEVGDEWAEQRRQSGEGSAPSASSSTAAASDIAAAGGTAKVSARVQAQQDYRAPVESSSQPVGRTSEPADAHPDSDVGSYEGASPAVWSRRSSFGSSTESHSSAAGSAERADEGDTEDADTIEHMRLSFPDPISSSASALAGHETATPADDFESDSELAEMCTIEKDEAPPVGLGGEYSLLLDTVEPPSDSTAASAASTSDTSSQASHGSSPPPSPSSNASRQLAAIHSDFESPVKLAAAIENKANLSADGEGSRSTSPLLSLSSAPSRRQTAGNGSVPTQQLESESATRVENGAALSPRLIGAEQHDGWRNPSVYDEEQVQAWLHSAKLFRGQPQDTPSDESTRGEGVDALTPISTCESGHGGNRAIDSMPSGPGLAAADGLSASTATAPRSMASSTATVVPPTTERTNSGVEVSGGKLPGAMPAEQGDHFGTALADDEDRLLDTASNRRFAPRSQVHSRRTIALLSVASAALAIALAGWARQPMPISIGARHEPAARPSSSAAPVAVPSGTFAFSEILEALSAKMADPVGVEASHRPRCSTQKASARATPDQLASAWAENKSLDDSNPAQWLPEGDASNADRAEATKEAARPCIASEPAKDLPVDSDRTSSRGGLAVNNERTAPTEKTCRCREHRRQRYLAKHLSRAPSLSIPPLLPAGVDNARVKKSPPRNMQGRVGSWTAWIDDPARLRAAADAAGARASAIVVSTVERGGSLVTSAARGRRKLSERVDKEYGSAKARWTDFNRRMHKANRRYGKLCRRSPGLPECGPYRFVGTVGDRLQEVSRRAQRSLPKWTRTQDVAHGDQQIVQRARHALHDVLAGFRPFLARHTKRLTKQARRAQPLAYRGGQETARYARSVVKAFQRQEKLLQKRFVNGEMRDGKRQRRRDKRAATHA